MARYFSRPFSVSASCAIAPAPNTVTASAAKSMVNLTVTDRLLRMALWLAFQVLPPCCGFVALSDFSVYTFGKLRLRAGSKRRAKGRLSSTVVVNDNSVLPRPKARQARRRQDDGSVGSAAGCWPRRG